MRAEAQAADLGIRVECLSRNNCMRIQLLAQDPSRSVPLDLQVTDLPNARFAQGVTFFNPQRVDLLAKPAGH